MGPARWFAAGLGLLLAISLGACANQAFPARLTIEETPPPAPESPQLAAQDEAEKPAKPADDLPRWESADCQFSTALEEMVECGYVIVPEDRTQVGDTQALRTARLYVAIVRSHSPHPAPDAVIYFSGGPGQRTFSFIDQITPRFAAVLEERDLIFFDQRGVGYSEPSLDCPEVMDWKLVTLAQPLSREEVVSGNVTANRACRQRLVEAGVNLAAYTSAASAADVNDLRLALGYQQLNLYGVSYGSRLALTVLRDFGPEGVIRSAILDSVYPPQADLFVELAPNAQRIFDRLFAGCAADAACRAAYPDLEMVTYDLVAQLTAEPVTVVIPALTGSKPYTMSIDGDTLVRLIFNMLYDTDTLPLIPKMITQLAQEDYSSRTLQAWLRWLIRSSLFFSEGMWYSVMCNEEVPFGGEAMVRDAGAEVEPLINGYFIDRAVMIDYITCRDWGASQAEPFENEPVRSDIPTLILAGEYDPITPPAWSQMAAETLSRAYYLEFPGVGHGVLKSRQCARDVTTAFLENPTVSPDFACLAEAPSLQFTAD